MPAKLTHEIFIQKLNKIHQNFIECLTQYKGSDIKIQFKCNKCSYMWVTTPHSILGGSGCPECGKNKSKNTKKWNLNFDDYVQRIPEVIKEKIEFLTYNYSGTTTRVNVKCKLCSYEWTTNFKNIKSGYGCIVCGHVKNKSKTTKSHSQFEKEINLLYNKNIKLLTKYINYQTPIEFICNLCNEIQIKNQAGGLLRRGCQNCCISKGEQKIKKILEENNIEFKSQFQFNDFKKFKYDFALFKNNILEYLIEYDGQHHYKPIKYFGGLKRFKEQQKTDITKNKIAVEKGIKLIRIPYFKYNTLNIKDLLI